MREPIAITGVGVEAPFGRTLDDLAAVFDGRQAHAPRPVTDRLPVADCRSTIAYPHWSDRSTDALFEAATDTLRAAIEDATLARGECRIGLAIGSINGMDFDAIGQPEAGVGVNALGRHCHGRLGLTGPLVHVMSACTSSAAALYWGKAVLENGDADVMLVGGADRIRATDFAGFNILRAMDPNGSRPFHADRRGITMGEGACFLVLERLSRALTRGAGILAIFSGGGMSCDAHHATAPRSDGLAAAICQALRAAGLAPSDIQYVNCHGTGTPMNDGEELKALGRAFGPHMDALDVGSTKGFIGHWLGTAAAIEAAVLLLVLRDQRTPGMPWLNGEDNLPAPLAARSRRRDGRPLSPIDHVMSNSLAFGGNNVSLIFSRYSRVA
ncbi:beta-ketoacyl-[acyl-carrier-protein] synthase family protein [uncultured Rhodospira sp.]|uniref:beta-ketoacyl-[acyl-carrier-protein] synthase family protein n=1 Tax=uncultured Rhodospira sp. TaxID=1936189 RepID=UPI00261D276F|nr:beta-ketoacyl-[acyl-carrier-protein] synthase family protein [uncultured Rhodospira sp.]